MPSELPSASFTKTSQCVHPTPNKFSPLNLLQFETDPGSSHSPGPPPSPRRHHGGGVLLSRVRAQTAGLKGTRGLASFTPSSDYTGTDDSRKESDSDDDSEIENRFGMSRSVGNLTSLDGMRSADKRLVGEEHLFQRANNSARFYYQGSHPDTQQQSQSSSHTNNISSTDSINNGNIINRTIISSPEQSRPSLSTSSYTQLLPPPKLDQNHPALSPRLVVLTPTTQEWNQIQSGHHLPLSQRPSLSSLRQTSRQGRDSIQSINAEDERGPRSDDEENEGGLRWNPLRNRQTGSVPYHPRSRTLSRPSTRCHTRAPTLSSRSSFSQTTYEHGVQIPLTRTITADHLDSEVDSLDLSTQFSPPGPDSDRLSRTFDASDEGAAHSISLFGDEWFPHYRVDDKWRQNSKGVLLVRSENGQDDQSMDSGSDQEDVRSENSEDYGLCAFEMKKPQLVSTESSWGITQIGNFGFGTSNGLQQVDKTVSSPKTELNQDLGGDGFRQFGRGLDLNEPSDNDVDFEVDGESRSPSGQIPILSPRDNLSMSPQQLRISPASPPGILSSHSSLTRSWSNSPSTGMISPRLPASRITSRKSSASSAISHVQTHSPHMAASTSSRGSPPVPTTYTSPPLSPRVSRRRQSQKSTRLSAVAGRSLPSPFGNHLSGELSAFSPFPSAGLNSMNGGGPSTPGYPFPSMYREKESSGLKVPPYLRDTDRVESTNSVLSLAPSIGPPDSPTGTPISSGKSIDDYVILTEAGRGAYGLVKRAKRKGPDGEAEGEEVIIKMIIKQRILADSWKRHRLLGPIPIELHIMDQISKFHYAPPPQPRPWDPSRPHADTQNTEEGLSDFDGLSEENTPTIGQPETHKPSKSPNEKVPYILGHPNVCTIIDFFEDREYYFIVMPRFGIGQDLFDRVEGEPDGLPAFEVRSLLGQICDGIAFLHYQGIVHRDIKDENVILDGLGHAQLIDFGSSAHWKPGRMWDTFSGTLDYASPEILRGEKYSGKEQDVWALGVVAYVLLVGETPFVSSEEAMVGLQVGSKVESCLRERCFGGKDGGETGKEPGGGGALGDAMDWVERACEVDLKDRPTAAQLLEHRFLKGNGGWTGFRGFESY
ncbi:kinase-like protein [Phaffia rhodozyma]|uniref:Kinase-like protein n=1 Tax=Phaffia rhodozyma TaxID=264483 RepID=A0A0F7SH39_PHARH|nr:kinase-like protein [Phaffia rhodozyma]